MKTRSVAGILLGIAFISNACSQKADTPLIFEIESKNGSKVCLIAIHHFAVTPAIESEKIVECETRANALAFEVDASLKPTNFWSIYEKNGTDFSIQSLSGSTQIKIVPALIAAGYTESEIKYLTTLHPVAVYRALQTSKVLEPKTKLVANLDIQLATVAQARKIKIIELEGWNALANFEKKIELHEVDFIINVMCDLLLNPQKLREYLWKVNKYTDELTAQPDIDTSWNKKFWFNTEALGLPAYTVAHDVDNRNIGLSRGIETAIERDKNVLIFIGANHVGGPNSVLKNLENRDFKIKRIQ